MEKEDMVPEPEDMVSKPEDMVVLRLYFHFLGLGVGVVSISIPISQFPSTSTSLSPILVTLFEASPEFSLEIPAFTLKSIMDLKNSFSAIMATHHSHTCTILTSLHLGLLSEWKSFLGFP